MKIIKNRLKKCCQRTHAGKPGGRRAATTDRAGYRAMNRCTDGIMRRPFATATATIRSTKPIGSSHSRLNHLLRPTRTRGAMPAPAAPSPPTWPDR